MANLIAGRAEVGAAAAALRRLQWLALKRARAGLSPQPHPKSLRGRPPAGPICGPIKLNGRGRRIE